MPENPARTQSTATAGQPPASPAAPLQVLPPVGGYWLPAQPPTAAPVQSRPWHQQGWPWLIVAVVGLAILATIGWAAIGALHALAAAGQAQAKAPQRQAHALLGIGAALHGITRALHDIATALRSVGRSLQSLGQSIPHAGQTHPAPATKTG